MMLGCDPQLSRAGGRSLRQTLPVSASAIILNNCPPLLLMTLLLWNSSPAPWGTAVPPPLPLLLNENICLLVSLLQYQATPENITIQPPHSIRRVIIPYYCNVSAALFFSAPCLMPVSHEQAPGTPLVGSLFFPGFRKSKKNGNNSSVGWSPPFPWLPWWLWPCSQKTERKRAPGMTTGGNERGGIDAS